MKHASLLLTALFFNLACGDDAHVQSTPAEESVVPIELACPDTLEEVAVTVRNTDPIVPVHVTLGGVGAVENVRLEDEQEHTFRVNICPLTVLVTPIIPTDEDTSITVTTSGKFSVVVVEDGEEVRSEDAEGTFVYPKVVDVRQLKLRLTFKRTVIKKH